MSFGWHPREHRAALDGMLMLTLEERGAYNTLLDLIYDRGAPIPDDARWLAGWMGVSLKRWAAIRDALIVKGKIHAITLNGVDCLMNERAAKEIENQSKLSRNAVLNGAKGGRKRAENAAACNENSDLGQATLEGSLKLKTETKTYAVVPPNGETTGGEPPKVDPDKRAWDEAIGILVGQGQMTPTGARSFFGRLLSQNRLEARDLLGGLAEAFANRTADPQGFLTKWAKARSRRREPAGPAKRVGFV